MPQVGRILIVDDEPDARYTLAELLREQDLLELAASLRVPCDQEDAMYRVVATGTYVALICA